MVIRLVFKVVTLLSAILIINISSVVAETESQYPYADIEALKKENVPGSDSNQNLTTLENKKANFSYGKKKRSINMIVGGKSVNGIAKQLTVTVGE